MGVNILYMCYLATPDRFLFQHVICAVHSNCREGNTALHLACQSNQLKAIEVLLQWGARANMTNASGFAPVSTLSVAMVSI